MKKENYGEQEIYLAPETEKIENVGETVNASEDNEIEPMYYNAGSQSRSGSSNTMQTADSLVLSMWVYDSISRPGDEKWYKFTPTKTAYYSIYTLGSLDTIGYLYDSNENLLDDADDTGKGNNFKITYYLRSKNTYYIKVKAFGRETGHFDIGITDVISVESITIDDERVTLNKGQSKTLTANVLPSYATNQSLRWESDDTSVVIVNQYTGRITAVNGGTACVCACAQDGSGKYGCCEVTVNVPVESIMVDPSGRIMRVGTSEDFEAVVFPHNADDKRVYWTTSDSSVASIDPETGRVTAEGVGQATIKAIAYDGYGAEGECDLTVVAPISLQDVQFCCDRHTMKVGETTYLSYDVYPEDATNQAMTWSSSNPDVATVNASTGKITARSAGTTTITITADDGGLFDVCELSVIIDTVTITKDGNYSNVIFGEGKVWKCNYYQYNDNTESMEPYDTQRSIYNGSIDFTEKELGLLYRIDPNGVIYYVKNKRFDDATTTDYLIYKDDIFKEIYGRSPRYFTYEDSQLYYHTGVNESNRYDVYSEAELIFGMPPRWTFQNVIGTVFETVLTLMSMYIPFVNAILVTYDIVTAFFFTDAFMGYVNDAANEFISKAIETDYSKTAARRFAWATTIVDMFSSLLEDVLPPDIDNAQIAIYESAYNNQSYLIKVSDSNQTVDLNEFIEHYKGLLEE